MKISKKNISILVMLIVALTIVIVGVTYAKYIYNSAWDYYLQTKNFYFESDKLGANPVKNSNLQWDGSSIEVSLKNSLSNGSVTNYNIEYRVDCFIEGEASTYSACEINNSGLSSFNGILSGYNTCVNNLGNGVDVTGYAKTECELQGYEWKDEPSIIKLDFNIELTDQTKKLKDVKMRVVASSTSPYSQTLVGDFLLNKIDLTDGEIIEKYDSYSTYDRLTISNSYNAKKCITIEWDSTNLRIDAKSNQFSDYGVDANNYLNRIKININSKENESYKFYKTDSTKNYTVHDFTVKEASGCE